MIKNMLSYQYKRSNSFYLIIIAAFLLFPKLNIYSQTNEFPTESRRFIAMINKDSLALTQLIHNDLIYTHSNGLIESKAKHIHNILSGFISYNSIGNEEFKLRRYGKLTLTNGIIKASGIIDKKPFDIRLRYSGTYIKIKGIWQLLNWQSTKI